VKNLSLLVAGRTKTHCIAFVCNRRLHPFRTKDVHDRRVLNCQRHPPQDMKYPDAENPKECTLEFHNKSARFRLPFYLVCDFESFLTPLEHEEDKKGKVFPYSLPSVGPGADPGVQAVSPQVT